MRQAIGAVERCRPPLCDHVLEQIASVQARAYAEIGLRPWSASEVGGLLELETSALWVFRAEKDRIGGFVLASIVAGEGEILALAVDPACRRQKIAQQLMGEVFRYGADAKIERLILEVASTNDPAISLYQILRFDEIGERRDYYRIGDNRVDAKLMEKRFD